MIRIFSGGGSRLFAGIVTMLLVAGCECMQRPKTADRLGSMQVAALSVTPWSEFRASLSPKFDLTAQDALAAATPDTRSFESSVLDAFRARAAVKLAPSAVLSKGFGDPGEPGVTAAGQDLPDPMSDTPRMDISTDRLGHGNLKGDAFLQHLAATALYQEVRLLERYVLDAVSREGYEAFVVRLQVTNQPHSDRWGYDAYANIGFFSSAVAPEVAIQPDGARPPVESLSTMHSVDPGRYIQQLGPLGREVDEALADLAQHERGVITYEADRRMLRLSSDLVFSSGSDHITSQASMALNRLANVLTSGEATEYDLVIEVHTDRQPISRLSIQRFPTNMHLSAHRAISVKQFLGSRGVDLARIQATGWGDQRPRASAGSGSENRRIEIYLVPPLIRSSTDFIEGDFPPTPQSDHLPIVVPLLVTDQIEAALISGRYEELRQFSLGLAAAYAGIGGEIDLEKVDQILEKAAGRSYRSLFTLGRLSNNMLRVRMAARQRPNAGSDGGGFEYESMARTHNVTVLLLVHRDSKPDLQEWEQLVHLATRYEYRWPDTGKRVGVDSTKQGANRHVAKAVRAFVLNGGYGVKESEVAEWGDADWIGLAAFAQGDDFRGLFDKVSSTAGDGTGMGEAVARRLYMDLQLAKIGSDFDSTKFAVRMRKQEPPSFGDGSALLVDDGKVVEAVISGVRGLDPTGVSAVWKGVQAGSQAPVNLAAISVEFRGGDQLVVRFPSLIGLGLLAPGSGLEAGGSIALTAHDGKAKSHDADVASFLAKGPARPSLGLQVSRTSTVIPRGGDDGHHTLQLGLLLQGDFGSVQNPLDALKSRSHYVMVVSGAEVEGDTTEAESEKVLMAVPGMAGHFVISESGTAKVKIVKPNEGSGVEVRFIEPSNGRPVEALKYTH